MARPADSAADSVASLTRESAVRAREFGVICLNQLIQG